MDDQQIPHSFHIATLIAVYLQGNLTNDQETELFEWVDESEQNRLQFARLLNEQQLDYDFAELKSYNTQEALARFKSVTGNVRKMSRPKLQFIRMAAAAVVLFCIAAGTWFYLQLHTTNTSTTVAKVKTAIAPGGNKAILTLGNGAKIILDNAAKGTIAQQSGIAVTKTQNGQVVYQLTNHVGRQSAPVAYNTISTPRGGQYQVILPDGSHVWLNAASSIRFPTLFDEHERSVEITGEVYFEVTKNAAKPFRVQSDKQQIEVLGTHFNIMAYADEQVTVTTLLEGSVRVSNAGGRVVIKPNQNVVMQHTDGAFRVNQVGTEAATAWKEGYFLFEDENIESIMRKVARWYNVDVVYDGKIAQKSFGGTISRFKNVSELLDVLQATNSIHFKIEGRRITVMP